MKIGRNAPCPCGSGKKYKKCCLRKEGVSLDLHWRRLNQAHDRLVDRLMAYAMDQFGQNAMMDALDIRNSHFLGVSLGFIADQVMKHTGLDLTSRKIIEH